MRLWLRMRNTDDTELEIGEVARRAGMRPSAVRYYEELGLVAPARRSGGRRRVYGIEAVERLALIAFADDSADFAGHTYVTHQIAGYSLTTGRTLRIKGANAAQRIETMRAALQRIARCGCDDLEQCAHNIRVNKCGTG